MSVSFRMFAPILLAIILAGCHHASSTDDKADTPVAVATIVAAPVDIAITHRLPGRLQAYREAEVRARVGGIVTARLYKEGQQVKKGDRLFQIDAAPLKVAFDIAAATAEEATAAAALAADKLQRYDALVKHQAVSLREHAEAAAENRLAIARLHAAQAAQRRTVLELGYASVAAPIAGRARRAMVTEGALVGIDTATALTTIEQIDPIHVNFSQPAAQVAAMREAIRSGRLHGMAGPDVAVSLVLPDGSIYDHAGTLIFTDLAIDPATDTIAMRAVLPNPEHRLLPGGYVQVLLTQAHNKAAVLLPQHALLRNADTASVLVVDANMKVEAIAVQATDMQDGHWIVRQGLSAASG